MASVPPCSIGAQALYRHTERTRFTVFNRAGAKVSEGVNSQLVAPGHDGRVEGALRLRQGHSPRPTSPRT